MKTNCNDKMQNALSYNKKIHRAPYKAVKTVACMADIA
jgi:hypothetical protein